MNKVTIVKICDTKYVVDQNMGERQLTLLEKHIDRTKYRVGDTLESVAYRQGQSDLLDYIKTELLRGRL